MKRLVLIVLALAFAAHSPAAPILEMSPSTHAFGKVRPGQTYEARVSIHNLTNKAVTLTDVHADCGCTDGFLPEHLLPAKKSVWMTVRYKPKTEQAGTFSSVVTVDVFQMPKAARQFRFSAEVLPKAYGKPESLDLGYIFMGKSKRVEGLFLVDPKAYPGWTPGALEVEPTFFKAVVEPAPKGKPGEYKVVLTAPESLAPGKYDGKVRIRGKVDTNTFFDYPFTGLVGDLFLVQPAGLDPGDLSEKGVGKRRYYSEVHQAFNQPFRVLVVKNLPPWLKADVKKARVSGYVIEWKLDESKLQKTQAAGLPKVLEVETDTKEEKVISIPFYGTWGTGDEEDEVTQHKKDRGFVAAQERPTPLPSPTPAGGKAKK